jgi:hypothetical protein
MTDYHTILILSILRLMLACGVVFVLMPALLFPPFPSKSRMERLFGMFLYMAGISIVMMHVFVFLKLNDNIAVVIISIWIVAFKWWNVYRKQHVGFVLIKSVLLRWIEIFARPSTVKRLGASLGEFWKQKIAVRLAYAVLLIAIVTGAVVLRIGPIWDHPAPLSTEYYETLEQVKHLQINEMYQGESRIPIGMPMLISALCTASQVNPTLAVHFVGLLSAILLCGSIFFSVYTAIRRRLEAALASVIFAVAFNLFPGSVVHQIEADSMTLAVVFLLPSLSFFINYLTHGGRARLSASMSGLAATAAVNLFVGALGLAAIAVILCSTFFILPSLKRLRGRILAEHVAVTTAVLGLIGLAFEYTHLDQRTQDVLKIIFYDQHFSRYAVPDDPRLGPFLVVCAGLFVAPISAGVFPASRKQWHLHLMGWGFIGTLLLLLASPELIGLNEIVPAAQVVFILSVTVSLAAGMCAGVLLDVMQSALHAVRVSRNTRQWARTTAAVGFIAAAIFFYHGNFAATSQTAEPDGFVRNLYVIERTFIPYQWTIVAHRGILLAGMNRGRFLDYDYFTAMYDPVTYRHGVPGAIPTALVFIFVEQDKDVTGISSELIPNNRNAMREARKWCETYLQTHNDMTIFYKDDKIIIYELRDPHVPSLRV